MPSADERRRSPRRKKRLKIRYWNSEIEGTGYTFDISATGILVETHKKLNVGTRLHLEVSLPTDPYFCECVVARVLHSTSAVQPVIKNGVGVRFVGISEAMRQGSSDDDNKDLTMDLRDPQRFKNTYEQHIKHGGLFVSTDWPPRLNTQVHVRLELPTPHGELNVRCTVVHVSESPMGVGLQLLDLEYVRGQLEAVVTAVR